MNDTATASSGEMEELREKLAAIETEVAVVDQWTDKNGNVVRIVKKGKLSAAMIDQILQLLSAEVERAKADERKRVCSNIKTWLERPRTQDQILRIVDRESKEPDHDNAVIPDALQAARLPEKES